MSNKFRYYVVSAFDGVVFGFNDPEICSQFLFSEEHDVIDTETNQRMRLGETDKPEWEEIPLLSKTDYSGEEE